MDNFMFKKLLPHRGHTLECVSYGDWKDPADVCIECTDCNEVLVSAEDFEESGEDRKVKREDVPEFIGQLIDIFEDFLEERNITLNNPDIDDAIADGQDPEGLAIIYGTDYGDLQCELEKTLVGWEIIEPETVK